MKRTITYLPMMLLLALASIGCGDGTEADRLGIAAQCATDDDCFEENQVCLTEFKGGYCGTRDCTDNAGCPEGSACVTEGGANFCFRTCLNKPECNMNRDLDNEANCSSSVVYAEAGTDGKACVPPSGT